MVETLKDFIEWTQKIHQNSAACMKACANENEDERAKILLKYVSKNEKELATILDRFTQTADKKALNTWTYEFFNKSTISKSNKNNNCIELFEDLEASQVIGKVITQHNEIITFYRDLYTEAEVASTKELLEQLISLEENHIKQMVQSTNRMNDM